MGLEKENIKFNKAIIESRNYYQLIVNTLNTLIVDFNKIDETEVHFDWNEISKILL